MERPSEYKENEREEELEKAIRNTMDSIEKERFSLGDDVYNSVVSPLRDKLKSLEENRRLRREQEKGKEQIEAKEEKDEDGIVEIDVNYDEEMLRIEQEEKKKDLLRRESELARELEETRRRRASLLLNSPKKFRQTSSQYLAADASNSSFNVSFDVLNESVHIIEKDEEVAKEKSSEAMEAEKDLLKKRKFGMRDFIFPPKTYTGGFFEHFLVVGVKRSVAESEKVSGQRILSPEILFSFPKKLEEESPENKKLLESAANFCFPEKLSVRTLVKTPSGSSLNQLIHGSDQAFSRRHVFCFNAVEDSYHWGVCLVKEELVSMPLSFLGDLSPAIDVVNKGPSYVACDRAYVLLSRYPLFEAHYEVLLSMLSRERAYHFAMSQNIPTTSPSLEELTSIHATKIDRLKNVDLSLDLFSKHLNFSLPLSVEG